jgi:multidrug efflux pump subunit AcrA (membrane-fusion protein)
VHLDKKVGVLSLPIEAVVKHKDGGKQMVTRVLSIEKGRARTEKVSVKTGARNEREVEITDGLREGDRILVKPGSAEENAFKM